MHRKSCQFISHDFGYGNSRIETEEKSYALLQSSKVIMSDRLVQIEKLIIDRFAIQDPKKQQTFKLMLQKSIDQNSCLQDKISQLLMILNQTDQVRLQQYLLSASNSYMQPDTDTSLHSNHSSKSLSQSPKQKGQAFSNALCHNTACHLRNSNSCKSTKVLNETKNANSQQKDKTVKVLNQFYSSALSNRASKDQQLLSSLQNSQNKEFYDDFTESYKQRKLESQVKVTDNLLQSEKIKQQLKKLQLKKKLMKIQQKLSSGYPNINQTDHLQDRLETLQSQRVAGFAQNKAYDQDKLMLNPNTKDGIFSFRPQQNIDTDHDFNKNEGQKGWNWGQEENFIISHLNGTELNNNNHQNLTNPSTVQYSNDESLQQGANESEAYRQNLAKLQRLQQERFLSQKNKLFQNRGYLAHQFTELRNLKDSNEASENKTNIAYLSNYKKPKYICYSDSDPQSSNCQENSACQEQLGSYEHKTNNNSFKKKPKFSSQKSEIAYDKIREKTNVNNQKKSNSPVFNPKEAKMKKKNKETLLTDQTPQLKQSRHSKKVMSQLLFRAKSSPFLIAPVEYNVSSSNQTQLIQRNKVEQNRHKQMRQRIIKKRQQLELLKSSDSEILTKKY